MKPSGITSGLTAILSFCYRDSLVEPAASTVAFYCMGLGAQPAWLFCRGTSTCGPIAMMAKWSLDAIPDNYPEIRRRWDLVHTIRASCGVLGLTGYLLAALASVSTRIDIGRSPNMAAMKSRISDHPVPSGRQEGVDRRRLRRDRPGHHRDAGATTAPRWPSPAVRWRRRRRWPAADRHRGPRDRLRVDIADRASVAKTVRRPSRAWAASTFWSTWPASTSEAKAEEFPEDEWREVLDVNLSGAFWLSQAAGRRHDRARTGGRIIHFSSTRSVAGGRARVRRLCGQQRRPQRC